MLKTTLSLFAAVLLAACATPGRQVNSPAGGDQLLRECERQFTRAVVRLNRAELNEILADDFSCAVAGDEIQLSLEGEWARNSLCTGLGPREKEGLTEQMQKLESGLPRSAEVSDISVSIDGNIATVVSTQVYRRWYPYDGSNPRAAKVTDTWVQRDGVWRVIRRVSVPIPASELPANS